MMADNRIYELGMFQFTPPQEGRPQNITKD